jgi:hypothetical protein
MHAETCWGTINTLMIWGSLSDQCLNYVFLGMINVCKQDLLNTALLMLNINKSINWSEHRNGNNRREIPIDFREGPQSQEFFHMKQKFYIFLNEKATFFL